MDYIGLVQCTTLLKENTPLSFILQCCQKSISTYNPASNKVEIDAEATEKIRVSRSDFLHALENDIKPAFGTSADEIERLGSQGIINWGTPVATVLEDGELFIQQARSEHTRGIISILLEGPPNSGKTALAAKLALKSKFPFIKLCSPEDMVGYTETAKCQMIKKIFDDAYKSRYSCILVDSIERLLDYGAIGRRYSNLVLQALLVLLKKEPPKGRRLLVLCTSSRHTVLEEMEMISAFTSVLHVSNLHTSDQLIAVLEESDCFQEEQLAFIKKKTEGRRLFVGIKKLLAYIDLAKQNNDEHRVEYFLAKLEDEECLEPI